jgi:hypothetical protein
MQPPNPQPEWEAVIWDGPDSVLVYECLNVGDHRATGAAIFWVRRSDGVDDEISMRCTGWVRWMRDLGPVKQGEVVAYVERSTPPETLEDRRWGALEQNTVSPVQILANMHGWGDKQRFPDDSFVKPEVLERMMELIPVLPGFQHPYGIPTAPPSLASEFEGFDRRDRQIQWPAAEPHKPPVQDRKKTHSWKWYPFSQGEAVHLAHAHGLDIGHLVALGIHVLSRMSFADVEFTIESFQEWMNQ